VIQADYYMTDFANGADDRQNNILIGAGIVIRWYK
jgi:outer membrane immunogenic protein